MITLGSTTRSWLASWTHWPGNAVSAATLQHGNAATRLRRSRRRGGEFANTEEQRVWRAVWHGYAGGATTLVVWHGESTGGGAVVKWRGVARDRKSVV